MWKGIVLAYGRFTGGNTEYNHLSNGARVIVLKEGKRTFTSWIHLKGGELIDKTVYPDSYVKDDWRKRPLVRGITLLIRTPLHVMQKMPPLQ